MGDEGPQTVPLNQEVALALPVDSGNASRGDRYFTKIPDSENLVTPFIRVFTEAYPEMGRVIGLAGNNEDFIYLLGWDLAANTGMGPTTFGELVTKASNERGVAVRVMLYLNQKPGPGSLGSGGGPEPQNQDMVDFINALTNGGAVHDNRYLRFGSHHQKLLVVKHGGNLTAFCGGMDIHPSRTNWHDVHVKVEGRGAFSLHQVFVDRWTDHPITKFPNEALVNNKLLPPPGVPSPGPGELQVQVVATYGNGDKHAGLDDLHVPLALQEPDFFGNPNPMQTRLENASRRYTFAPNGDLELLELTAKCIAAAQRFIYIEDQYLVQESLMTGFGRSISALLADKLAERDFKRLVILVPRSEVVNGELHQAWRRRRTFIGLLRATDPAKVIVCTYKYTQDPNNPRDRGPTNEKPVFVHSKFWVFDDEFCIVSSGNCNRRGMTHDSELGIGIFDPNFRSDRLNFAHDLRMRLWMKHLNPNNSANPLASG